MPTKDELDRWDRMRRMDAQAIERRVRLTAALADDERLLTVIRGKFPGLSTAQLIAAFELLDTGNAAELSAHITGKGVWKAYVTPADVEVTTDAN